jgi:hypothetical protein
MGKTSALAVASLVGASVFSHAAIAKPVTSADLSGKKICWNNGDVETYSAGGKYNSARAGDGTWAVSGAGVGIKSQIYNWAEDIEKLADGTFSRDFVAHGQSFHHTGQYCK